MYVVYLDVLFLLNWVMDTFIFYCVSLVLNQRKKHLHIIGAGGMAAAVYCMLLVIPILRKIPYSIYALVIPVPSLLMLYKPTHYKTFFKEYLVSMLIASVFGGAIFQCWYLIYGAQSRVSTISLCFLMMIALGVSSCFYGGYFWLRKRFILPTFEYLITIYYREKNLEMYALLDTGNMLYTPRNREPVIVAEYEVIKPLLPREEQLRYEKFAHAREAEIEEGIMRGEYSIDALIPFNSVGCKNGFLWSIKVDKIMIQKGAKTTTFFSCVVGIVEEKLFSDRHYQVLLHPEFVLEEGKVA